MSFVEAINSGFQNYANFNGRAQRSAYWYWILFTAVCQIVLGAVDTSLFGSDRQVLQSLFSLATLLPTLAVTARRLHDVDRSGWWMLIALIPLAGFIVLLVFNVREGTAGPNQYGTDPLSGVETQRRRAEPDDHTYQKSSIPRVTRDKDQ